MIKREWEGYEVGDAEAAGEICGIPGTAYQAYTRRGWTSYHNPPGAVTRDVETGRKLYPLRRVKPQEFDIETVEEWHAGRPGRGNWGGEGARAHYPTTGEKPMTMPKGVAVVRCSKCKMETHADDTSASTPIRHEPTCSGFRGES